MNLDVKRWEEEEEEELSVSLLRKRYSPKSKYRVSADKYEPGTTFPGVHREGLLFVLSGQCKFTTEGESAFLNAQSYMSFSRGNFHFSAVGNSTLHVVFVWNIEEIIANN